ncbi:MipA/OmpV family protein [Paracoccaceae bacterium Fryx2]|nr:MipA/OmpV family protein [Paracoccaceae bacterium Fryx2]
MVCSFRGSATALVFLVVPALGAGSAAAQDGLSFTLGVGGQYAPSYFGSDSYEAAPTGKLSVQRLSLGPLQFGSADPYTEKLGFAPRGSFRIIGDRKAKDNPELAGLTDLKTSVEIGVGLGYEATDWRAFADLRYGVIGHESAVAEFGADWKAVSTPQFKLNIGPRLLYGSGRYNRTYFGVTAAESLASGLAPSTPDAGLVSAGIEIGASYDLGNAWALEGSLNYDRLRGDAANSPITDRGSRDQASASLVLTRRFSLGF